MTEKVQNQVVQKDQVNKALTIMDKNLADVVLKRVKEMEANNQLMFPPDYAVGNALKSAYLVITNTVDKNGTPVLQSCSKESIANALLDMVIQGLNPAKKQCYFIPYGKELTLVRSYFGDQTAVMNALNLEKKPYAVVIYEGDIIEIGFREEDGEKVVLKHETSFENMNKKIIGAYAILYTNDGVKHYEIMTWEQIQRSWSKSKMANNPVHKEFPEEMAKRTVLRRLAKHWLNTSDDSNLFIVESYNRSTEKEYIDEPDNVVELQHEVETKANQEPLVIEHEPEPEPETPTAVEQSNFDDELGF